MKEYKWNEETVDHFIFESNYVSKEVVFEMVKDFVEVDCQLEDGDSEDDMVMSLLEKIFTKQTRRVIDNINVTKE